ncbi:hypothetical protein [Pseudonocardia sp. HH130630-07]|uniref:hypothetical protein n=1 Tax=Pseudonocardia sp. HH130630-07 TaxID=1690815 RepID=UPI0012EA2099|nr:hypothetical protein [Pseudonocardia sp. HH130630-07]
MSEGTDPEALVAFVERLAGSGRGGAATAAASSRIVGDVRDGRVPAGLRSLSAALDSTGPAESSAGSGDTLAGALAREALVVLSETGPDELARVLGELTGDGMRIVLTGGQAERLAAVRAAFPPAVSGRVVDRLPTLPSSEFRRLRTLLATVGADRSRAGQEIPPESALPAGADVADCCEQAARVVEGTAGEDTGEARIVAGLLRDLDADRLAAVTEVAAATLTALAALDGAAEPQRLRDVAGRLVHGGLRTELESLRELAADQRDDRAGSGSRVEQDEPLPEGGELAIRRYLHFLDGGGRTRSYFRPQEQKDAEPLLQVFRVDGAVPQTHEQILAVSRHLHLADRDTEIARLCTTLGLPVPEGTDDLPALIGSLDDTAAAARSVGALRHDVLFLQQGSPVSVPDLASAERVARAIVDHDEQGDPAEAADELERMAAECEAAVPDGSFAPEYPAVVDALRDHDPEAYAAALAELGRARRELADVTELESLLQRLSGSHPDLVAAWTADAENGVHGFGLVQVAASDAVLSALPAADAADLVVVLGAGALQADGLLLTAVAPRMLAVVSDEPRAESSGTTLIEVLNQASARFLRGTGSPAGGGTGEPAPASDDVPADAVPAQAGPVDAPAVAAVPAPRPASAPAEDSRPSAPSAMAPARRGADED